MGPLAGLRILDLTSVLMGPYATQVLGEMGADVIKVEAPEGDVTRQIGPQRNPGMGPVFLNANRGKRSVAMDLKAPGGVQALLRLAKTADVLVTNVRPRAMARLGLGPEALAEANPRLIQAALVGFDQQGPYADRPAYDDLIQGAAGIPHAFERSGRAPAYIPTAAADRIVGLAAVNAILAAVIERERSGLGQRVEIPMFETMAAMVMGDHMGGLVYDPPHGPSGYPRHLSPDRRPYATADGWICALVYTDAHWRRFFAAIGRPEMPDADPRYASFPARMANINLVYSELSAILQTRTTEDWLDLFQQADIPAMPMHTFESLLEDPHLAATGFFRREAHPTEGPILGMAVPARFSRTPAAPDRPAPGLGLNGEAVLSEAGFSAEEIAGLAEAGALRRPG